MITYTIHSTKIKRPVTFFTVGAGHYIFVDLNGCEGTRGKQICKGGSLGGETLRHEYRGDCDAESMTAFRATCRAWWRAYLRQLRLNE